MTTPVLDLVVVNSHALPGMLSLRTAAEPNNATATVLRKALADTGFEAGEAITVLPTDALHAMAEMLANLPCDCCGCEVGHPPMDEECEPLHALVRQLVGAA